MNKSCLRIATRESQLALWQANHIKEQLCALHQGLEVEIVPMTTKGDKILDQSLSKIGGKGLFTKELEVALLENRADIAVHCVKDMPYKMPDDLVMPVICERGSPWDAFVSANFENLNSLPANSVIGTSSLRRQAQLLALRPDLQIRPLRGNLTTRLNKLDENQYDAIILAAAGLERLGWSERIRSILSVEQMLPAVGQGALGIQIRENDPETLNLISPLHHAQTALCVHAERAMNTELAGSCQVPIGGYATLVQTNNLSKSIQLIGLVAEPCGSKIHRLSAETIHCQQQGAEELGKQVAQKLKALGAEDILDRLRLETQT